MVDQWREQCLGERLEPFAGLLLQQSLEADEVAVRGGGPTSPGQSERGQSGRHRFRQVRQLARGRDPEEAA